jgi:hypothetical protein
MLWGLLMVLLHLFIGWGLFLRRHLPGEPLMLPFIHLRLELLSVAILLVFHGDDNSDVLLVVMVSSQVYDASSDAQRRGFEVVIGVGSNASGVMRHSEEEVVGTEDSKQSSISSNGGREGLI